LSFKSKLIFLQVCLIVVKQISHTIKEMNLKKFEFSKIKSPNILRMLKKAWAFGICFEDYDADNKKL